jgi:hypothetical protein
LAPELETDALTEVGQGWVSACMLAHANSIGTHVTISVRGGWLWSDDAERRAYSDLNGGFWGNLFTEPAQLFACTPAYVMTPYEQQYVTGNGRDCAIPYAFGISACFLTVMGECSDPVVCSSPDPIDDSYPSCGGASQVVTAFLQPSLIDDPVAPPPMGGFF